MGLNPSLTSRLRIGFAILFALLLAVSLIGVGRLFQIRVDFEDDLSRLYEVELESGRVRASFALEQAAIRPPAPGVPPSSTQFRAAAADADAALERVGDLAGDPVEDEVTRLRAAEARWRRRVAVPLVRGDPVGAARTVDLTQAVYSAVDSLQSAVRGQREEARDEARDETRETTILVAAGLAGALVAALLLFSGLINSMRAPLTRLVEGSRRLAGGELSTRVETGGPVEIRSLGLAFNEMADSLEADARERERIEQMKDDFVLTVSHELRTPVTVLKGFAEVLEAQRNSLDPRQREAVRVIGESSAQLQEMINDLLDLARSDAGRLRISPEKVAVRALVQRVARQMRPDFERAGQRLLVKTEPRLPKIQADPGRIGQVLTNLLTNANKYSGEGSTVRVTAVKVKHGVELSVSDDGPGLDGDSLDLVFDRFWRAESGETRTVGGTGLGLAIAKSLVELHGGEITAESRPGEGATFRFRLPTRIGGAIEKGWE